MKVSELIKRLEQVKNKDMELRVLEYNASDEENMWVVNVVENCQDLILIVSE
jgi:hypothetical protein